MIAPITRIAPVIEAVSGTIKVEAEIDNRSDYLIAGMVVTLMLGDAEEKKMAESEEESDLSAEIQSLINRKRSLQ